MRVRFLLKKAALIICLAVLAFIFLSISGVILYRFVNPPVTPLMLMRYATHDSKNGPRKIIKQWKNLNEISPNVVLAVVAAEDNNFPTHFGVDWEAIKKAHQRNKRSKRTYGGSTISQQTAKNVFLTPSRTIVRKGFEVYFTYLIEIFWGKQRIMEVYLNVVEMGRGIYGFEAASQKYFGKPAIKLGRAEAALLATALPSPLKRNPAKPGPYMLRHQARILSLMDKIQKVEL